MRGEQTETVGLRAPAADRGLLLGKQGRQRMSASGPGAGPLPGPGSPHRTATAHDAEGARPLSRGSPCHPGRLAPGQEHTHTRAMYSPLDVHEPHNQQAGGIGSLNSPRSRGGHDGPPGMRPSSRQQHSQELHGGFRSPTASSPIKPWGADAAVGTLPSLGGGGLARLGSLTQPGEAAGATNSGGAGSLSSPMRGAGPRGAVRQPPPGGGDPVRSPPGGGPARSPPGGVGSVRNHSGAAPPSGAGRGYPVSPSSWGMGAPSGLPGASFELDGRPGTRGSGPSSDIEGRPVTRGGGRPPSRMQLGGLQRGAGGAAEGWQGGSGGTVQWEGAFGGGDAGGGSPARVSPGGSGGGGSGGRGRHPVYLAPMPGQQQQQHSLPGAGRMRMPPADGGGSPGAGSRMRMPSADSLAAAAAVPTSRPPRSDAAEHVRGGERSGSSSSSPHTVTLAGAAAKDGRVDTSAGFGSGGMQRTGTNKSKQRAAASRSAPPPVHAESSGEIYKEIDELSDSDVGEGDLAGDLGTLDTFLKISDAQDAAARAAAIKAEKAAEAARIAEAAAAAAEAARIAAIPPENPPPNPKVVRLCTKFVDAMIEKAVKKSDFERVMREADAAEAAALEGIGGVTVLPEGADWQAAARAHASDPSDDPLLGLVSGAVLPTHGGRGPDPTNIDPASLAPLRLEDDFRALGGLATGRRGGGVARGMVPLPKLGPLSPEDDFKGLMGMGAAAAQPPRARVGAPPRAGTGATTYGMGRYTAHHLQ